MATVYPSLQDTIQHAVNHSLTLLKMGKKIARNILSWSLEINKLILWHLVGFLYYLPTWMMHGQTHVKFITELIQNSLVHLFRKTPLNRVNNWYYWVKSVAVKNRFRWRVKFVHKRAVFMKLTCKNLEDYSPLNHGGPDCVTVTIVTDLKHAKIYLMCDGSNVLSYIQQWGLRCGAAGWGTELWTVKVAGSIPDAIIRIFQRFNSTGSPQALNTFLCRLSRNYGSLNLLER
jgi:hypothetical protein